MLRHMSKRPPGTLVLRSPDAATPERVARLAALVVETIRATGADPSDFTLTVTNLSTSTEVRPRSAMARVGLRHLAEVVENPTRAVERHQEWGPIASALGEFPFEMFPSEVVVKWASSRRELGRLDETVARQMRLLGKQADEKRRVVRGGSQTYSKVLRIGRARAGDPAPRARVEFKGRVYEFSVMSETDTDSLYEAVRRGTWCRIWLDVAWEQLEDGSMRIVERLTTITKAAPFDPVTGREFLQGARPLFDLPGDAEERVSRDRGDGA